MYAQDATSNDRALGAILSEGRARVRAEKCKKLARIYFEPNKKTQAKIDLLKQENKSLKIKISRIAVRMAQLMRQGFKAGAAKL